MKEYQKCSKELLRFIEKSPSCYHVIENIRQMFLQEGFAELKEEMPWELEPGKGYFTIRNGSSVIAFRIPKGARAKGFHIIAAHSDSPTYKVKMDPEMIVEERYVKLNTEKYGGMIYSTWLDRPLSVAGRIAVREQASVGEIPEEKKGGRNRKDSGADRIISKLVNIDEDLLVIPNTAIHMNRDMNKGVEYNPQIDMLPLFADASESRGKGALLKKTAKAAGVKLSDILGYDLFLYVREKGRILGESGEFILSPKLDDLQCVYTAVRAFKDSRPAEYINVCAVFDNEEVGSGTRQGANSTFLEDVLMRIGESMGEDRSGYLQWVAGSFLISADNAHAVHPNHPEKADPTNRPYLNGGIVIKYHGSQKYATDALSAAKMKAICAKAEIPCQSYANRSDVAGGSTLGNISTSHVSAASVDIGLPQLAMHSAMETAGVKDTMYAIKAFHAFYEE